MNIAIVGAGVVGATTAYELARSGHTVTVLERRASAGEDTSFAPGALLGPALLAPWAHPAGLGRADFLGAAPALQLGRGASLAELRWLWHWRRAARLAARSPEPSPALCALAALSQFSQSCHAQTVEALELEMEQCQGALLLLRDAPTAAPLRGAIEALRGAGVAMAEVDAAGARKIEPGLAEGPALAGALHLPNAAGGNCRQFTGLLRQAAQALGASFVFQADVARLSPVAGGMEVQLHGGAPAERFDAAVVCNGAEAPALLGPLGVQLGLVALWGASLTAALREDADAPQGVVIDVARQVSLARIGQRIRVAGGAELGRSSADAHPATLRRLYGALDDWFPGSAVRGTGMQVWRGARAVRPGGLPALGESGVPGLWLNLGHGDAGWALASGCARVLAERMSGAACTLRPEVLAHFQPTSG